MFKKFYHYFKSKKDTNAKPQNLSIVISLLPNYEVDVELKYADLANINIDQIPNMAEKYAELLIYINSSILKNKLLTTIEEKSYRSEDMKQKLFFDNVLSFHEIIRQEIKKSANNGPLISPMSVFNTK